MPAADRNIHEGNRVRVLIGTGLNEDREGVIVSTRIHDLRGSSTIRRKQCLCLIKDDKGDTFEEARVNLCLA